MRKRIAVFFHERQSRGPRRTPYTIYPLAKCWEEAGHKVTFVYGVRKFVPADLAILHIDLSVVPDEYMAFARRYPIVVNGSVKDIRKSTFSGNLVAADDPYRGRVIVKSDLNYAGIPERILEQPWRSAGSRLLARLSRPYRLKQPASPVRGATPTEYKIYDCTEDVPRACFEDRELVVERGTAGPPGRQQGAGRFSDDGRGNTPYVAILASAAVILALAVTDTFLYAATISTVARLLIMVTTCAALPEPTHLNSSRSNREPSPTSETSGRSSRGMGGETAVMRRVFVELSSRVTSIGHAGDRPPGPLAAPRSRRALHSGCQIQ